MDTILGFIRDYFVFMLILFLFSYLTPREDYRKFFHFFIGALMAVILMRPVLAFVWKDGESGMRERIESMLDQVEHMDDFEEGEDIYEWFLRHEGLAAEVDEESEGN